MPTAINPKTATTVATLPPPPAKPAFWNDPWYRALFFQAIVLGGLLLIGFFLITNTLHNLERLGIASGFGFLGKTAGFGISESLISYREEHSYGRVFMVGLLNTIVVSLFSIVIATILGFTVGIARLSGNYLVSRIATAYVETLRNIPLLLLLFFWYFAILQPLPGPHRSLELFGVFFLNNRGLLYPQAVYEDGFRFVVLALVLAVAAMVMLKRWARQRREASGRGFPLLQVSLALGLGLPLFAFLAAGRPLSWQFPVLQGFNFKGGNAISPEFAALALALSTYTAAYIAEIVRSGILAVNKGQFEASRALGLHNNQVLRLVIIPQALRVIIPPLTNQYLNLTKNSSLAAAIAYPDLVLVFAGTALMQTGQAVEIIGITMGVYLSLSLTISMGMNWYNHKMALVER